MPRHESRATVGLIAPVHRTRIGPVNGVTAHYNGPPMGMRGQPHSVCQRKWRGTQRFHMGRHYWPDPYSAGRHWSDVAYTFAVCHHGVALAGRGPGVRTAANGTNSGNDSWYACFFMVGGDEEPSKEMIEAAKWYARVHLGVTKWNEHSDHKPTGCPGTVKRYISNGVLSSDKAPESGDGGNDVATGYLGVDYINKGPAVRRWQNQLLEWNPSALPQYGADGHFGTDKSDSETHAWTMRFQRAAGIGVDGVVGPETRRTMQRVLDSQQDAPTPAPDEDGPFSDVGANHRFAESIEWAHEEINMGFPDGTFRSGANITRGQFAALLHRYDRANR